MTNKQDIDALVERFLAWPLPQSVCVDLCAADSSYKFPRSGTNLLSAVEAKQMIEYLLAAAPMTENHELLLRVIDQAENDLKAAHAEICKLQNLDPEQYEWPEWSSPANTLRWFAKLRAQLAAAPQEPQGDVVEAMAKGIYEADSEGGFDANDPRTFWRAANSYWPPYVWDSWLAIARAALSAAEPFIQARIAAAVEAGGWQPIETAPSGRDVLCAKWLSDNRCFLVVAQKVPACANRWVSDGGPMTLVPTHWCPLPKPPGAFGS